MSSPTIIKTRFIHNWLHGIPFETFTKHLTSKAKNVAKTESRCLWIVISAVVCSAQSEGTHNSTNSSLTLLSLKPPLCHGNNCHTQILSRQCMRTDKS